MFFRRGDMPEPAPKALRGLGPAPGYTVKRFATTEALNDYLKANHVSQGNTYNPREFLGGVVPSKKVIALLDRGVLNNPEREDAIDDHEFGHTYDLEHHDGKGWLTKDGRKFDDLSTPEQQAYIAAIRNPPPTAIAYDWSGAFANASPPTQLGQNAFGEGL